jgi:hypothetical protein
VKTRIKTLQKREFVAIFNAMSTLQSVWFLKLDSPNKQEKQFT